MIQRIQSIFLFVAAACYGALFGVPFAMSAQPDKSYLQDQMYNVQDNIMLLISAGLAALLAFVAIFLFKNRRTQLRLGYIGIILGILLIIEAIILFFNERDNFSANVEIQEQFGIFLPVIAIIFVALANRFIKKDDKLVRSMDRLR